MDRSGRLLITLCSLASTTCHHQAQHASAGALERLGEYRLEGKRCEGARAGTLSSHDGGLWFQDEAMRERAHSDQPNTSWEPDEVLLSHLGGGWGQLIPHKRPALLIATRSSTWSEAQRDPITPAQLVTINTSSLAIQPLWDAPAGYDELELLGRTEDVLVVLGWGSQGKPAMLWTLTPGQPTPLSAMALTSDTDARPGAPEVGHRRWPILQRGDGIYLVDVEPTGRSSSRRFKTEASHIERVSATEIMLYFRDNSCALATLDAPETWSALPRSAQLCSHDRASWDRPTLDGQLAATHYAASPTGCQVQHHLSLPQLPDLPEDEDSTAASQVSIAQLKPMRGVTRRLLVRGATLTTSFSQTNKNSVETVSAPTFAMALPPERVKLELVRVEGQAFWEVQLDLWLPYEPSPACIQGQLLFETASSLEAPSQRAVIRQYEEFGKCE